MPSQKASSDNPLAIEIPTEPIKKTFYHAIDEAADKLSLQTKIPICFELLDIDYEGPAYEKAGLESASIEEFTAKLQQLGFKCTRTADYLLVQKSASDKLLENPLDARTRDFEFKGSVQDLKFAFLEHFPPPASTGSNLVNRMGPQRTVEFRIQGGITVRELMLKIASQAKLPWHVYFVTSEEKDKAGQSRRKVQMARFGFWDSAPER